MKPIKAMLNSMDKTKRIAIMNSWIHKLEQVEERDGDFVE
jgi:hypothetical protein